MEFKCKVQDPKCGQLFSTEHEILNHFKIFHKMKETTHEFPCHKNNECKKQFLRLKSLKNHASKCVVSRYVLSFKLQDSE